MSSGLVVYCHLGKFKSRSKAIMLRLEKSVGVTMRSVLGESIPTR